MRGLPLATCLGLFTLAVAQPAAATWSIAAVDPQTGEVGVVVASCVPAPFGTTILPQVAGVVPGVGAVAAQAQFSQQTRDAAVDLLAQGASADEVIAMITASDPMAAVRQYGVVTLDGKTAAFTGQNTQDWAGDAQGDGVTAQGNILYGPEVVSDALAAFEADPDVCPFTLADRLLVALEAGANRGGDNRCSMEQTALAAVLVVAGPDDDPDAPYLDLRIPSQEPGEDNPVALLRASYDVWRMRHPADASRCDDGDTDGSSTSGDSSEDDGTSDDASATSDAGTTEDTSGIPPVTSSGDASTTASETGGAAPADDPNAGDCSCTASRPFPPAAWFALLVLGCTTRRRAVFKGGKMVSPRKYRCR